MLQSIVPGGAGPIPTLGSEVDRGFDERVELQNLRDAAGQAGHSGNVMALDHVNLTIPDGQTMSIVGPSGCGKSTLLRVVAGLDPFTGRVFYDDQDMASVPPKDRGIGMVFQSYALYPQLESRGNLSFFFKMHRAPDEETEERIRVTSEIMGIGFKELLARKPRVLSGGQQQRVAIARAIVRRPRLFLFDEPLSHLDAKLRAQTRIEINRLFRRFEITAVYVTHDQSEAIMLGDQIAVMRAGTIEQVGTYQELMRRPDNAFVAGFLGVQPMNLLHGGIVADGVLRLEKIEIPLPEPLRSQTHAGQEMILGVRPQAARITQHDEAVSQGIRVPGIVEGVEPDFEHDIQLAYLRTGTLSYAASTTIDTPLQVGDACRVLLPADQLHFFDGQTEQRLG